MDRIVTHQCTRRTQALSFIVGSRRQRTDRLPLRQVRTLCYTYSPTRVSLRRYRVIHQVLSVEWNHMRIFRERPACTGSIGKQHRRVLMFRQYIVLYRPVFPLIPQLLQYIGMLGSKIIFLRTVFHNVVKFPFRTCFITYCFPVTITDGTIALMLPIHIFMQGRHFLRNGGEQTGTYQRMNLISTMIGFRICSTCCFQNSRHDIRQITRSSTQIAMPVAQFLVPGEDKRSGYTTFIGTAFVFPEWSVRSLRPGSAIGRHIIAGRIINIFLLAASQFQIRFGTSAIVCKEQD